MPVFAWVVFLACVFLRGLYTHTFNNTDGLRHQVLIDIEPVFSPEHLRLTLEAMTQMHFIFSSVIECAPSLNDCIICSVGQCGLLVLQRCFTLFRGAKQDFQNTGSDCLPEEHLGYLEALQTT